MATNPNQKPKQLGKAGNAKGNSAQPPKTELAHFKTLHRSGKPIHFLPSQVVRVRAMAMQDGHNTDVQDRSGRTQVQEEVEQVLDILGVKTVKFHRYNIQGDPHEVFFVVGQICRVRQTANPSTTERTIVTDASGDITVMEPEDVVLRTIDNALDDE